MAAACGGSVVGNDGAGGGASNTTGGGGDAPTTVTTTTTSTGEGGSGGGSVVPPKCAESASEPGPYPVTFRFTNPGNQPAFVREECHVVFTLTQCADDYAAPLAMWGDCTIDCSEPSGGCIACGACMLAGTAVTPNSPVEVSWSGQSFTFGTTPEGCSCHVPHVAPAAKYRVTVPVYASQAAAEANAVAYEKSVDVTLPPPPGGVIEIPLSP